MPRITLTARKLDHSRRTASVSTYLDNGLPGFCVRDPAGRELRRLLPHRRATAPADAGHTPAAPAGRRA